MFVARNGFALPGENDISLFFSHRQRAVCHTIPFSWVRSILDNHRTIVGAIQKSPYYVELEERNMHFERYTDKYAKEKDNTRLASFYSSDVLSRYVPTGTSHWLW